MQAPAPTAPPAGPYHPHTLDGVTVLPLRTPTLPPATTTNTVLVGRRDVWIVDPATPWPDTRDALATALDALPDAGRRAAGVVLTHHHADHVGAAAWLAERFALPVCAHPRTAALLEGRVSVDRPLDEGDVLLGSDAPDDAWRVLFTPGHAPGHLSLWEPRRRVLVVGDMVASVGTILIAPPDGHMATYLASLARLADLEPCWVIPAHGAVLGGDEPAEGQGEAVARLRFTAAHRLEREGRVRAALDDVPRPLAELTARSYPDVPPALHGLASGSARAHLDKLVEDGLAHRHDADRWTRR